MLRRHIVAVLALPFTVTVLVPVWIYFGAGVAAGWPDSAAAWLSFAAGLAVLPAGVALFVSTLQRFATEGGGTLAPWDPPVHFVVSGPYRYVRNPMISGVIVILAAEALLLRSWPHAAWAAGFFAANLVHLPFVEEPALIGRFGASYREYLKHVPRFLPRLSPWSATERAAAARPRVVAVIPAAGKSTRFGSDKRVALVDGVPMLARVVQLMRDAGCDEVIVVHGPEGLPPSPIDRRPVTVENPSPERGMFSSIQAGLEHASNADVVLVHPADMPFVRPATIRAVVASCSTRNHPVCPRFNGKRGHPLAIPAASTKALLHIDPATPLNEALVSVGAARIELDSDDAGVVRDVDRVEDL